MNQNFAQDTMVRMRRMCDGVKIVTFVQDTWFLFLLPGFPGWNGWPRDDVWKPADNYHSSQHSEGCK